MGESPIRQKKALAKKGRAVRIQYGALPYRFTKTGVLQILVVTTRTTRRWIIPKGWPMSGRKPAQAAAQEAYEEAGVRGDISATSIGTFTYDKLLDGEDGAIPCEVKVFPLLVKRQTKSWPEATEREFQWLTLDEAAATVGDEGLRSLIHSFAPTVKRKGGAPKSRQRRTSSL
jgi:8-oxo-dGTP pyrophosphatase MutT (NUDIX family)